MCGPADDWDFGHLGSAQLLLADFRTQVLVSGRQFGRSAARREFDELYRSFDDPNRAKYFGNFAPDDRPIAELVDEHFRARFERSDHAPKDFQDLYDVPGAL